MTAGPSPARRDLVDQLRRLVLLARSAGRVPDGRLGRALGRLDPPVDPTGPGWLMLCHLLAIYDQATGPPAASPDVLAIARRGVVLAAAALVGVDALWTVAARAADDDKEVV